MKKTIIKGIIFAVLTLSFSMSVLLESTNYLLSFLRVINGALLSFMLICIYSNMFSKNIYNNKLSKKLSIVNLLWGITFLLANIIEYGTIVKILNVLAIAVVVSACYELFFKKDNGVNEKNIDMNIIKFGYIWVGFVLLIPILLIFVFKGY